MKSCSPYEIHADFPLTWESKYYSHMVPLFGDASRFPQEGAGIDWLIHIYLFIFKKIKKHIFIIVKSLKSSQNVLPSFKKKMAKKSCLASWLALRICFLCVVLFFNCVPRPGSFSCSSSIMLSRSIHAFCCWMAQLLVAVVFLGFGIKYQEIETFSESSKTQLSFISLNLHSFDSIEVVGFFPPCFNLGSVSGLT